MKPNPFASLNHFTVPLATIPLLEKQGATALCTLPPERDGCARTLCPALGSPSERVPYRTKATRYVPGGIGGRLAHHGNPRLCEYRRDRGGNQARITLSSSRWRASDSEAEIHAIGCVISEAAAPAGGVAGSRAALR